MNVQDDNKHLKTIFFCWSKTLLLLLFIIALSGCSMMKQPRQRIDYYTLNYQPPVAAIYNIAPLPVVLRVEPFSISPEFDTDKIVYQQKKNTLSTYNYHRWRSHPAELASHYLARDLRAANLFTATLPPVSRTPPSHLLEGIVNKFLEEDSSDGWQACVEITFTLIKHKEPDSSKKVVFQKTFLARRPCSSKDPQAVARAMAQAMSAISSKLTPAIYQALQ